jgi:transposase
MAAWADNSGSWYALVQGGSSGLPIGPGRPHCGDLRPGFRLGRGCGGTAASLDAGTGARGVRSSASVTEPPRYPSDISDARWALVEPALSAWQQARLARSPVPVQPKYPLREIWNALLYLNRTGVQWQYLPHDFPHYQSVNSYYNAWRDEGIFERLNADMTQLARIREGRKPEPTAGVVDTQSVKTSGNVPASRQGVDAGKKIVGRKRGIVTDTIGMLLTVIVMAASVTENAAGMQLLSQAKAAHPQIAHVWADSGFKNKAVEHAADLGVTLEVVPRKSDKPGFHVVKRRWVVERTIGWLMLHRRLARDYEKRDESSQAMINLAMIDNATKRITGETTPTWRDWPADAPIMSSTL